ncbi:MarR family transcriptional regulator [Tardiphaga alba]|uniref:MarR family transcriptional regulator n=1 Tax=Tardiphaga alba TaxID=340268 RepID=A0ABX8ADN8_9BRAD|nr:MarR family winged helix-turn-helix transcriptional regulator [Tardiphaga alba]QUS41881.1 MarR family transcriptional regulator [Tardiphaga alba]
MLTRLQTNGLMASPQNSARPIDMPSNGKNQEIVRQFLWDIASINVHLDEIRHFWAKELGISGPQWMILMAVDDLNSGGGVSVKDVSAMLHVDPSFVTTQSKILEKNGFMRREPSRQDARVVLMSLSEKAGRKIATLTARRDTLSDYVLSDFDGDALRDITGQLAKLKARLQKATVMLSLES